MALWDGVDAPLLTGHTPCAAATTVGAVSASSSSFWKSPAPQPWCLVLQESFPLSQAPSGSSGGAAPQSEDARWTHWSTGHSMPQPHMSRSPAVLGSKPVQTPSTRRGYLLEQTLKFGLHENFCLLRSTAPPPLARR